MKEMSKAEHAKITKAVKDGLITQKQHDKMPAKLLLGIIKKKKNTKKGSARKGEPKGARLAYDDTKDERKKSKKGKK